MPDWSQNHCICERMGYLAYAFPDLTILFQVFFLLAPSTKPKSFSSWNFLTAAIICILVLISGPVICQCHASLELRS